MAGDGVRRQNNWFSEDDMCSIWGCLESLYNCASLSIVFFSLFFLLCYTVRGSSEINEQKKPAHRCSLKDRIHEIGRQVQNSDESNEGVKT